MKKEKVIKILNFLKLKPISFYEFVTGNNVEKDGFMPAWSWYEKDERNYDAYNKICLEQNNKIDKIIKKI